MPILDGVKILDLSQHMPGHHGTLLLGDMGADILRIEAPTMPTRGGLSARREPAPEERQRSQAFDALGRNKRSIALNLKDERGRDIFYKLAREADVVLEGFRPGVVKRLGVDYATISKMNPRIVYASISGYGQDGPYSQMAGHDINYIAQSGALSVIGPQPDEPPAMPMNFMADLAGGGTMAALGIVSALFNRERSGRGQFIDISMAEGAMQLTSSMLSSYLGSGRVPVRGRETFSGSVVYYNTYQCQDGKWISIDCIEPYFYESFCRELGRDDWLPDQHAEPDRQAEMIAAAREIFRTRTRDEWHEALNKHDLCAMRILGIDEMADDPHVQARGMIMELDHPKMGRVKQVGSAIKFSETPSSFRSFAPAKGEHTDEVLTELGFGSDGIAALRADGVVV
ncbi:MAG: CaiB/BaiF CoA-transferase family protein [Dehalococcoidia bacterium]